MPCSKEGAPGVRYAQLALFCRVYEDGTVTGAAAAMVLSQPAASMQIRELERELGTELFERRGRRLVPTEAGELFYAYASALVRTWEEAEQALASLRAGRGGHVALGASTTGVMYHLPPLLHAYHAAVPDVRLALDCANTDRVCGWLVRGRADVGLVWGPVRESALVAETVVMSSFALILPAGHPLAEATAPDEEVSPEALQDLPFVLQERGTMTRRFVEESLGRAGVGPREAMALTSTEEVKLAVEAGLGVGVVAARAVAREVGAGALALRRIRDCDLRRPLMLVTRAEGPGSAAAEGFVAFVRARGAELLR